MIGFTSSMMHLKFVVTTQSSFPPTQVLFVIRRSRRSMTFRWRCRVARTLPVLCRSQFRRSLLNPVDSRVWSSVGVSSIGERDASRVRLLSLAELFQCLQTAGKRMMLNASAWSIMRLHSYGRRFA